MKKGRQHRHRPALKKKAPPGETAGPRVSSRDVAIDPQMHLGGEAGAGQAWPTPRRGDHVRRRDSRRRNPSRALQRSAHLRRCYGSNGGFTGAVSVQVSADDPKTSAPTWITDPNMTALTSAAFATYLGPIGQLRLSSSALASGSFVLKAFQSIGQ
jgi:hypothetical protein